MKTRFLSALGACSLLLVSFTTAHASSLVWNQYPGASSEQLSADSYYSDIGYTGSCSHNSVNDGFFAPTGWSAGSACDAPAGQSSSASVNLNSYSTTGISFSGAVASASLVGGGASGGNASASSLSNYIFDVLDPAGVTIQINQVWSWTGATASSQNFATSFARLTDGCNSTSGGCSFSSYWLVPSTTPDVGDNLTQTIFLVPGTYGIASSMLVQSDYNYLGQGAVATNGSYTVTLTLATVPLPPAIWLFGSGLLGIFGLAKKRSQSSTV